MDPSAVDPELRSPLLRLRYPLSNRWILYAARLALRLAPTPRVPGVRVEVPGGVTPQVRVLRATPAAQPGTADPEARTGALLWFHGGGMIIGTASQDDHIAGELARDARVVTVSVDYRLAPEHPFPAALDDCLSAWRWVRGNADELGIDPARMAVGGQSAGAGLAASLAQRLLDLGESPVAQVLFCPMLDDRTAARRDLDQDGHFVWDNRNNRTAWRHYLDREPGGPDAPSYAAPARREDLTGLAPAWIGVGDIDLFHAECQTYAERLHAARVDVDFRSVPGGPHGFELLSWGAEPARLHRAAAAQWLAARMGDALPAA